MRRESICFLGDKEILRAKERRSYQVIGYHCNMHCTKILNISRKKKYDRKTLIISIKTSIRKQIPDKSKKDKSKKRSYESSLDWLILIARPNLDRPRRKILHKPLLDDSTVSPLSLSLSSSASETPNWSSCSTTGSPVP